VASRRGAVEARDQLERARRLAYSLTAVEESLTAARRRYVRLAPMLLDASSIHGGQATLSTLISGLAATSGLRVASFQLHSDTTGGAPFHTVGLQAELTGDVSGLVALLRAFERGRPLIAVRSLAVDQSDPGAASDQPEALRVSLRVEALVHAEATAR
jgi:hypothetical protein